MKLNCRDVDLHNSTRQETRLATNFRTKGEWGAGADHRRNGLDLGRSAWQVAGWELSPKTRSLLNVLVFFDPDMIPERPISDARATLDEQALEFLVGNLR